MPKVSVKGFRFAKSKKPGRFWLEIVQDNKRSTSIELHWEDAEQLAGQLLNISHIVKEKQN